MDGFGGVVGLRFLSLLKSAKVWDTGRQGLRDLAAEVVPFLDRRFYGWKSSVQKCGNDNEFN